MLLIVNVKLTSFINPCSEQDQYQGADFPIRNLETRFGEGDCSYVLCNGLLFWKSKGQVEVNKINNKKLEYLNNAINTIRILSGALIGSRIIYYGVEYVTETYNTNQCINQGQCDIISLCCVTVTSGTPFMTSNRLDYDFTRQMTSVSLYLDFT